MTRCAVGEELFQKVRTAMKDYEQTLAEQDWNTKNNVRLREKAAQADLKWAFHKHSCNTCGLDNELP